MDKVRSFHLRFSWFVLYSNLQKSKQPRTLNQQGPFKANNPNNFIVNCKFYAAAYDCDSQLYLVVLFPLSCVCKISFKRKGKEKLTKSSKTILRLFFFFFFFWPLLQLVPVSLFHITTTQEVETPMRIEAQEIWYLDTCTSPMYPYQTDTTLVLVPDTTPILLRNKFNRSYL